MRLYHLEIYQPLASSWRKQREEYTSCAKAHRICKHQQESGVLVRVIMTMQKLNLKDLQLALQAQARRG